MGLFDKAFDVLGLTPDMGGAIQAAQFDPYNVQSSFGSLNYDPSQRLFSTSLNPQITQGFNTDPMQTLGLMRQQAAPYQQQERLNLENRLFSQGLLQHSAVDQPLGARRSLFDAQQQQDFGFQLQSQAQALQNLLAMAGLEQNLFGMGAGMGQLGQQAAGNVAGLMAQEAAVVPNLIGSAIGAAGQAYGGSGG